MIICKTIAEIKYQTKQWQQQKKRVALVPTMGNLHCGHLRLIECACEQADKVIVSIFVNPLQFAPHEDFSTYPRTPEQDINALSQYPVAAVFMPGPEEIVAQQDKYTTQVTVPFLSDRLCGISRPGFFQGVCTIVCKLFHIIEPQLALFGEKDYQQLLIIKQMVKDLNFPIKIYPVATVRDKDGLALSSRNQYLTEQQRQLAPNLYQTLCAMEKQILAGERDYQKVIQQAQQALIALGFKLDYLEICQADNLQIPAKTTTDLVIAAAVFLQKTRLIDNIQVKLSCKPLM